MAWIIKKSGKYLAGQGYATGIGYTFTWTHNPLQARRFGDDGPVCSFAALTGGKGEHVPNTRSEAKAIYKARSRSPNWQWAAPRFGL